MDRAGLVGALEQIAAGAVGLTTLALAEAAPGEELTLSQWRALFIVGGGENGARVGEVALRVGVTVPATGRLLRRLERRGLLVMAQDERDRRATRARLTPRGAEVRGSILRYRRSRLDAVAARVEGVRDRGSGRDVETVAAELGQYA